MSGRGFNFKQSYLTVVEDFAKEVEREFPLLVLIIVLALVLVLTLLVTAIVYRFCRRQKLSETSSDTTERTGTEASAVTQQLLRGPSDAVLTSESGRSSTPLHLHSHAHLAPLGQGSLSSVTHYFSQEKQRSFRGQQ